MIDFFLSRATDHIEVEKLTKQVVKKLKSRGLMGEVLNLIFFELVGILLFVCLAYY